MNKGEKVWSVFILGPNRSIFLRLLNPMINDERCKASSRQCFTHPSRDLDQYLPEREASLCNIFPFLLKTRIFKKIF